MFINGTNRISGYVAAFADGFIKHQSVEEAQKWFENKMGNPNNYEATVTVYALVPVQCLNPKSGLTNSDATPPTGGTPVAMRIAA